MKTTVPPHNPLCSTWTRRTRAASVITRTGKALAFLTCKDYLVIDFGSDQFAIYRVQHDLSVESLAARQIPTAVGGSRKAIDRVSILGNQDIML